MKCLIRTFLAAFLGLIVGGVPSYYYGQYVGYDIAATYYESKEAKKSRFMDAVDRKERHAYEIMYEACVDECRKGCLRTPK